MCARLLAGIVWLAAASAPPPAMAEVVRGQSRELGIRFEVAGGSDWCQPAPLIRLDADAATAFKSNSVPFQQMIGRIRAVVAGQCDIIEELAVEGYAKGQLVFVAETSRQTGWRHLVVLDPVTKLALCLDGQHAHPDCPRRAQAYRVARQALRPDTFPGLELTTLLDPRLPTHLGWKAGDVIGKITIAEADHIADYYDSSNALADSFFADMMQACASNGGVAGEPWTLEGAKLITLGGFACQRQGVTETTVAVIAATAAGFDIFGLWSDKADPESVKLMGWGIALAVKDRGW